MYGIHQKTINSSTLKKIQNDVKKDHSDIIAGIGGGRSVDTAKMVAFNLDIPFVSVPTAASHDGIASPFVSVKSDKPHSIVATAPLGVFVDIDIIKKAPFKLTCKWMWRFGSKHQCCKDWKLGTRDKTGEYYGRYSANLAIMSAEIVMEKSSQYAKKGLDVRVIVEALISAGVASCIAGSSRPCSGAEHLFSHALINCTWKGITWRKMWIGCNYDYKTTRKRLEKNSKDIEGCRSSNYCKTNWIKRRSNYRGINDCTEI